MNVGSIWICLSPSLEKECLVCCCLSSRAYLRTKVCKPQKPLRKTATKKACSQGKSVCPWEVPYLCMNELINYSPGARLCSSKWDLVMQTWPFASDSLGCVFSGCRVNMGGNFLRVQPRQVLRDSFCDLCPISAIVKVHSSGETVMLAFAKPSCLFKGAKYLRKC